MCGSSIQHHAGMDFIRTQALLLVLLIVTIYYLARECVLQWTKVRVRLKVPPELESCAMRADTLTKVFAIESLGAPLPFGMTHVRLRDNITQRRVDGDVITLWYTVGDDGRLGETRTYPPALTPLAFGAGASCVVATMLGVAYLHWKKI